MSVGKMVFDQKAWTHSPHLEILSQLWQDSQIILWKNQDQNYKKINDKIQEFLLLLQLKLRPCNLITTVKMFC